MATADSVKNKLVNKNQGQTQVQASSLTLKDLLGTPTMKKKFEELMSDRAPQYITSIINLYNSEATLQKCEPMSVVSSAMVAATLDLPVDKNLGYAWIVPYGNKAQFQLGYKGYIQLALRSGQYRFINVTALHEGELKKWNPLTEEIDIDFESRQSDAVIGYAAYFELLNGFRKTIYWSKEHVEKHRKKFSKSDFGWKKDWDAMATKTVLKALLSKWGILSVEMQKAVSEDTDEREIKDITNEAKEVTDINDPDIIDAQPVDNSEKSKNQKPSVVDQEEFDFEQ
ncbi:recombinase RecT [Peribacillus asahii]|uniref:recombinase RecT n=1 Tax=Peribacillus asahii TaxID=228899 RepID=UPI002079E999|nr:recombinase RecT [Peribacillus asahii]USK71736.1 recombinase RecT [Peribacillus asahii]